MHVKTKPLGLNFLNIIHNMYQAIATENKVIVLDRDYTWGISTDL